MLEIIIRDANINDAKAIRQVSKECWLNTYPNAEYGITREDLIARFTYPSKKAEEKHTQERQKVIAEDASQHYWVAEIDKNIVAFCLAKKGTKRNTLQALHVIPKYQGNGIGKKLMTVALEWLGNEKDIELSIVVYNKRAIIFYERFGFIKTGKNITTDRTILPSGQETPQIEMLLLRKLQPFTTKIMSTNIHHDSETPAVGKQVITAAAFIHQVFNEVEKVFLPKRSSSKKFMPDKYELPGGHLDFGEDIILGLKREIKEEFGIDINVGDPFYVFTYENDVKESHSIEVVYFVTFANTLSEIKLNPEDHSEYKWLGEDELEKIISNKGKDDPEIKAIFKGFSLLNGSSLNFG